MCMLRKHCVLLNFNYNNKVYVEKTLLFIEHSSIWRNVFTKCNILFAVSLSPLIWLTQPLSTFYNHITINISKESVEFKIYKFDSKGKEQFYSINKTQFQLQSISKTKIALFRNPGAAICLLTISKIIVNYRW